MNPEETRHAACVMIAHAEGKKIECRNRHRHDPSASWEKRLNPVWDCYVFEYRVAPEPREWTLRQHSMAFGVMIVESGPHLCGTVRVREVTEGEA